ncbi:MAG: class I SAM-dependent methyltransferase [Candidatus Omnitrophica bacterium]|nr:class I SAM-dependent methyltransferase [Candidatus Omnitrophota bacterium]
MDNQAYDDLARVEDTHWYHTGRRKLVEYYMDSIRRGPCHQAGILDVGCGTGGMLETLRKYGAVTGLEISAHAAGICLRKHPSARIRIGSANDLDKTFAGEQFDIVTFFNVLYHEWILDDTRVLKEAFSLVRPGGFVVINEPAYKFLYRDNDRICMGKRRYTVPEIRDIMKAAGFNVARITYFNSISFLPLLLSSMLQRAGLFRSKKASDELGAPPPVVNGLLKFAMSCELAAIKIFGGFPFGVSILAVGRKDIRP